MRTGYVLSKAAWRLIETAKLMGKKHEKLLKSQGFLRDHSLSNRLDEVQLYDKDQLSDDFDAEAVATGNWNPCDAYDPVKRKRIETPMGSLPKRLGDALKRIGVELDWSDCTTTCDDCGKLLNTNPQCYGWRPSYVLSEHAITCKECLDPEDHLRGLEGDGRSANNLSHIDPADYGYFKFQERFQNGFHPGQDSDPKKIATAMKARGFERFLFNIDDIGQFDATFSLYVHEDERELAEQSEQLTDAEGDGPSVSGALQRGLQEASAVLASLPEGGVKYVAINGDKVTTAKTITPEDFIEHGINAPVVGMKGES